MLMYLLATTNRYVASWLGLIVLFFAVVMAQWVRSLLQASLVNLMVGVDRASRAKAFRFLIKVCARPLGWLRARLPFALSPLRGAVAGRRRPLCSQVGMC